MSVALPWWLEELAARDVDASRPSGGGGALLRMVFAATVLLGGMLAASLPSAFAPFVGPVLAVLLLFAAPVTLLLLTLDTWHALDVVRRAYRLRRRKVAENG
jgi:hypothetical protein